jgi:hypothetical protein
MVDYRVITYQSDLPLFHKLGLRPFNVANHVTHFVGEVKEEDGSYVKIWVTGAPAQSFDFEIFDAEGGNIYKATTGSGCLEDFWPTVAKIMGNMFVIKAAQQCESADGQVRCAPAASPELDRSALSQAEAMNYDRSIFTGET